jgi:hypothetical protein
MGCEDYIFTTLPEHFELIILTKTALVEATFFCLKTWI